MLYLLAWVFVSFLSAAYFSDRITEVKTNIYVTSFGPVSDTDMVRADMKCAFFHHQHLFYQPRGDSQRSKRSWSLPVRLIGKNSAFFALFLVSLQLSPPSVIIASSLRVSPHAAVLKWAGFSTRQHNVYSSDNFHLINDLKRPLVIPATSLFILGSPVYHAEASRPPSHRVISNC